jgi:phytanoyl-CoA hydroxylase
VNTAHQQTATVTTSEYPIDRYNDDGFCILPDLFSGKECAALKAEILRILKAHARSSASVYVGAAVISPLFQSLSGDDRIIAALRQIMPEGVMFMSDKIVFKSGQRQFATPWHIDAFYWRNTRPKLSVWIPLDDCSADNGTLQVVRKSHLRSWQPAAGDTSKTNGEFENIVPDRQWSADDEVTCNVRRGSAVIFSDRLLHASHPNPTGRDRYTIISTYHAPAEDEPFDTQVPARRVIVPRPRTQQ